MSGIIDAVKAAVGPAWAQVVQDYGVDASLLDGRQHPCPVCRAGVDRFRVTRDGRYFCQWCRTETGGWGDWLDLIVGSQGVTLRQLLTELGRRYNVSTEQREPDRRRDVAQSVWRDATLAEGSIVEVYLRDRGLPLPPEVRYHPGVWDGKSEKRHPAMLAKVVDAAGEFVTVHRTFLRVKSSTVRKAAMESPRKVMPTAGLSGAAIRLWDIPGAKKIVVAEGIETAIAARRLLTEDDLLIPAYSLVSTSGMKSFVPPDGVEEVLIYGDNDESAAGQAAAWALCAKLRGRGLSVPDPKFPPKVGNDWADVVQAAQLYPEVAR